ncbi:MAG: succinate--CoA ligase, partial [Pseudomonadota bacterium]
LSSTGKKEQPEVHTQGILQAIDTLKPNLPIAWSVHGTGDEEAIAMLKARDITPYPTMDSASKAAVVAGDKS